MGEVSRGALVPTVKRDCSESVFDLSLNRQPVKAPQWRLDVVMWSRNVHVEAAIVLSWVGLCEL